MRTTHITVMHLEISSKRTLSIRSDSQMVLQIMMSKGGAAHAIVCHFCPYACSNNDYAYPHLAATHLNIQWGCGICFDFINGYVSKFREHVLSHQKRSSKEWSHSSHKKDEDEVLGSPSESVSSDKEAPKEDCQDEDDDHQWSGLGSNEVSQDSSNQDSD